jgi:hypothetical protein
MRQMVFLILSVDMQRFIEQLFGADVVAVLDNIDGVAASLNSDSVVLRGRDRFSMVGDIIVPNRLQREPKFLAGGHRGARSGCHDGWLPPCSSEALASFVAIGKKFNR